MPAGFVFQRGGIPTLLSHAVCRPNGGDADIPSWGREAPEGRHVSKLVRRPEPSFPGKLTFGDTDKSNPWGEVPDEGPHNAGRCREPVRW